VSCDKLAYRLPSFKPQWTVRKGIEEIYDAFTRYRPSAEEFLSSRFIRLKRIRELQNSGELDQWLTWRTPGRLRERGAATVAGWTAA
jgi:hypothetical protein